MTAKNPVNNSLIDALEMPDGRVATIESGKAFRNFWSYSGFSGMGYLVCVDGEPVGQYAMRFDALRSVSSGRPLHQQTESGLAAVQA